MRTHPNVSKNEFKGTMLDFSKAAQKLPEDIRIASEEIEVHMYSKLGQDLKNRVSQINEHVQNSVDRLAER